MLFSSPSGTHKEEVHWNLKAKNQRPVYGNIIRNKTKKVVRGPEEKKFQLPLPHTLYGTMGPCVNNDAMDIYVERESWLTSTHCVCQLCLSRARKCRKMLFFFFLFLGEKNTVKNGRRIQEKKEEGRWYFFETGDGTTVCAGTASSDLCVPVLFAGEKGNPGRIFVPGRKSKTFATQSICDLSMERLCGLYSREGGARNFNNEWPPTLLACWTGEQGKKKDKKSY